MRGPSGCSLPIRWKGVGLWAAFVGVGVALLVLAALQPAAAGVRQVGDLPEQAPAAAAGLTSSSAGVGPQSYRQVGGVSLGPGIGARPLDMATDPRGPWAYVANSGSGDISVLSGTEAIGTVFVGGSPSLVRVHPATGRAYVVGVADGQLLLLDRTTVVGSVAVGGNPVDIAFEPTSGYAYLAMQDQDVVVVLSGTTVLARIPVAGGPAILETDPAWPWVYVGRAQSNSLAFISGTTVVADVDLGAPTTAVAVAADSGWAYAAAGEQVMVLSGTETIAAVPAWGTAVDLAYSPSNGYIYVSRAEQFMAVISGTEFFAVVDEYMGGGHVQVGEKGLVYVADRLQRSEWLLVVRDTDYIGVFHTPCDAMAASAATGLVYTTSPWFLGNGEVIAFDRTTATRIGPAPEVVHVAVHPHTAQVYLAAWQNQQATYDGAGPRDPLLPRRQAGPANTAAPDTTVGQLFVLSGTQLLGPIVLDGLPWELAVHPQTGLAYAALGPKGVAVFDGAVLAATIPVEGCASRIAVQPLSGLVYVSDHCLGRLYVIAGKELVATLPLSPNAIGYLLDANPANGYVYVAAVDGGGVTVVSGTHLIREFLLCPWAERCISWGMDSAPDTGYTYVTDASHDRLWVISGTTVYTTVAVPVPQSVRVHPTSGLVYVSTERSLAILRELDLLADIPVTGTDTLVPSTQRAHLFASGPEPGQLLVLIGTHLVQRLSTGLPIDLGEFAVDPASGRLYVSSSASSLLILEESLPYRFFLHLILVGPRGEGGSLH